MKKILFFSLVSILVIACSENAANTDMASSKASDMQALFEKNLATVKSLVAAFEKKDIEAVAAQIADTAVWSSPAYGDMDSTKTHWVESLKYYMDNWNNLHLADANFLPGIDQVTHEPDGSVRYYGTWEGVHSSGLATKVRFYGTYDFNADNKIISGADFFDLGGLMNAVQAAKQ